VTVINDGNAPSGSFQLLFREFDNSTGVSLSPNVTDAETPLAPGATFVQSIGVFIDTTVTDTVRVDSQLLVNGQETGYIFLVG
jgi:hypothetical protein